MAEAAAANWSIDTFHPYLYGTKFTLETDHCPVEKMSHLHQKTLSRLQENMNKYDFVVTYRKGKDNAVADALSRNPVDALEIEHNDFAFLQNKDKFLYALRLFLKEGKLPSEKLEAKKVLQYAPFSMIQDRVLYYCLKRRGMADALLAMVPESMRKRLVEGAHCSRFGGHAGMQKTILRLQEDYFFPGMTSFVNTYIETCQVCQRSKSSPSQKNRAPLTPLPIPSAPGERLHIDLVGKLRSNSDKKYVAVIAVLR